MKNIVKVQCMHFWSDWTELVDVEIDLDKYVFFSIEWRGNDSWHIVGYKCDKEYNWTTEELSEHQVTSVGDLADFIVYANAYPKSKGKFQGCKVSRFNNLHYGGAFYRELSKLLKLVADKEQVLKENNDLGEQNDQR